MTLPSGRDPAPALRAEEAETSEEHFEFFKETPHLEKMYLTNI
jgi:hypothetical protein